MERRAPQEIKRVAVIGAAGTVGTSWTAFFLSRGLEVFACDPAPGGEERLQAFIDRASPLLRGDGSAKPGRLVFTEDLQEAVSEAEFIQENGPEDENLKARLLAELDRRSGAGAVIASSTSSLLRSRIVKFCERPERCIIAHPFNPPHLIPLVEIVGADAGVVDWSVRFFTRLGKRPVVLQREIVGHIANRLTAALWREAVNLVALGVGRVEDIDAAVANGPGLRWAIMGPHLTYHLGGGPGGIEHYLEHLGPSQERRWADLGSPQLTAGLKEQLVRGVLEEAQGLSIAELERSRDESLAAILAVLRGKREKSDGEGV